MGKSAQELRAEIAESRVQLSDTMDAIGDQVSPGRMIERKKNRVVCAVRTAKDRVMGTVDSAGDTVSGTAHGAIEKVHDAAEGVQGMSDAVRSKSQGSPLLAGGLAFGIGFLAAVALPPSRKEREASATLMEKAAPVKDELTEAAHDVVGQLKAPAQTAVSEVKDAASHAAAEVSDAAKDAARQTKDEATNVASDLRS